MCRTCVFFVVILNACLAVCVENYFMLSCYPDMLKNLLRQYVFVLSFPLVRPHLNIIFTKSIIILAW